MENLLHERIKVRAYYLWLNHNLEKDECWYRAEKVEYSLLKKMKYKELLICQILNELNNNM
jgi:hypothetical protein